MKMTIRKKYFDRIKKGYKRIEFRDAHITFVAEETGETLKKEIVGAMVMPRGATHHHCKELMPNYEFNKLFTDKFQIWFYLEDGVMK